ncbi:gypsy type transposase [Tanacetum coccineum]
MTMPTLENLATSLRELNIAVDVVNFALQDPAVYKSGRKNDYLQAFVAAVNVDGNSRYLHAPAGSRYSLSQNLSSSPIMPHVGEGRSALASAATATLSLDKETKPYQNDENVDPLGMKKDVFSKELKVIHTRTTLPHVLSRLDSECFGRKFQAADIRTSDPYALIIDGNSHAYPLDDDTKNIFLDLESIVTGDGRMMWECFKKLISVSGKSGVEEMQLSGPVYWPKADTSQTQYNGTCCLSTKRGEKSSDALCKLQDHIVSSVLLTMKDAFLNRDDFKFVITAILNHLTRGYTPCIVDNKVKIPDQYFEGKDVKQHKSKTNKRLKKELAAFNGKNLKEIGCPNSRKPRKKNEKDRRKEKEDDECLPCALQASGVDFPAFWDMEDDLDVDHTRSNFIAEAASHGMSDNFETPTARICLGLPVKIGAGSMNLVQKIESANDLDIPVKADMSWGWRKLLQIQELVKPFFWSKLGNGMSTSLWYDRWCSQCPLIQYLSPRDITSEGYNLQTCVADLVLNNGWLWPQSWILKAPNLGLVPVPYLDEAQMDLPQWCDLDVWFSYGIPRHAFHLWLVMRNALKTQDRVECNNRLFKNVRRSPEELRDIIMVTDVSWVWIACWAGPRSSLEVGSRTKPSEMISCTNESKPLALPWGRTPRLNSGVRVRNHVVRNALCEKFYIPDAVHLEFPGPNARIHNSPTGKIGVYSRFFDFANYRIPLSQFLVDILQYFQINLSHLSVIAATKVSHFKILCRVHGFVPTVEMYLLAFIHHADPTKVEIGEREVREGEVPLLQLTWGRVIPLAGVNDQGGADVKGAGDDNVNESGDVAASDQVEEGDQDTHDEGANIVRIEDDAPPALVEKVKKSKKRKTTRGVSGSSLPPKKLRANYGTSRVGASTGGKSVVALQSLLEGSTLAVEVRVTAAATVPFVTSSVTPTPEHEDGGHADSLTGPNLCTQPARERFVVLSDSSHYSSNNVADDEVTSIAKSLVLNPAILTTAIATTVVADTSALVPRSGPEPVHHTLFADSTTMGEADADVAAGELESLKEQNVALEGQVSELEVKVLSDRVANIDSDLMDMALHMDEEFYRSCLKSPGYLAALGGALGRAIDKGMQDDLKAGIDHGRAGRGLDVIAAYDPSAEANFVSAVDALRDSTATLFRAAYGSHPPVRGSSGYWGDPFVLCLDVAHSRVQRLKEDVAACRLSLTDAIVPLLEPLYVRSLTGEASTSIVPATAMTNALSTTFIQASTVPPVL